MKVEFAGVKVESGEVVVVAKVIMAMKEVTGDYNKYDSLAEKIKDNLACKMADEFLRSEKMELAKSINRKEILDAIQLKIIEGFSLQGR